MAAGNIAIGRGVRIEVALTYSAAVPITAITAAKPPVVTSTAHGQVAKTVGYLTGVVGNPKLEGQAVRVASPTTNNFNLEDLSTLGESAVTDADFIPVATWAVLAPSTEYNLSGGEAESLDVTVLLDDIKQEQAGLLEAQSVSFTTRTETLASAGMQAIRELAREAGYAVFRATFKNGDVRFFRGQCGLPNEQISTGQVGSSTFNVKVKGFVLEGAA
jgi:Phage tail tube protein, TTP